MRILTALDRVAIWHEAAFPVDPHYATGLHEVGHALDMMGDNRASSHVTETLDHLYKRQHPEDPILKNMGEWLKVQFPGGAFVDQDRNRYLDNAETVAQAFADVELGANPSEAAKMLHQMVVEESQEHTSKLLKEDMIWPDMKDIYQRQHGVSYDPDHPMERPTPVHTRYHQMELGGPQGDKIRVPHGFAQAIKDMQAKYPHLEVGTVQVGYPESMPTPKWIAWTGHHPTTRHHVTWERPYMGFDPRYVDPKDMSRTWQKMIDMGLENPYYNDPDTGPMPEQETQHLIDELGP